LQNHFQLFGLEPAYALDAEALERAYRELQTLVHPDRFAAAGDAERRASMQWTTRVNEAYRTLRDPVQRARHFLEIHGLDVGFETNTQMPADFLMEQLETREALEGALASKDCGLLDSLGDGLAEKKRDLQAQIGESIDARKDYPAAAALVRKLMFLDKLGAEIDSAYEAIE
jgi:molecular chaperone HscB